MDGIIDSYLKDRQNKTDSQRFVASVNQNIPNPQQGAAPRPSSEIAAHSQQAFFNQQQPETEGFATTQQKARQINTAQAAVQPQQAYTQMATDQGQVAPALGYTQAGVSVGKQGLDIFTEGKQSAQNVAIKSLEEAISAVENATTPEGQAVAMQAYEVARQNLEGMSESSKAASTVSDIVGGGMQAMNVGADIYGMTRKGGLTPQSVLKTGKDIYGAAQTIAPMVAGAGGEIPSYYAGMGLSEVAGSGGQQLGTQLAASTPNYVTGQMGGAGTLTGAMGEGSSILGSIGSEIGAIGTAVAPYMLAYTGAKIGGALGQSVMQNNPNFRDTAVGGYFNDFTKAISNPLQIEGHYADMMEKAGAPKLATKLWSIGSNPLNLLKEIGIDTVICTELYRQKRLPLDIYKADGKFGGQMDEVEYNWYLSWGAPLAKRMQTSKILSSIVAFFFVPISKYMAYEMGVGTGSTFGKINFKALQLLCKFRRK